MNGNDLISIGDLARRTGLSVSAMTGTRFYEARGLIQPLRTGGNQRRFLRADIRRLSFLMIAQQLGIGLDEIGRELASLPQGRAPTGKDWAAISARFAATLDARIAAMERVRRRLDGCIGCGCLSLTNCAHRQGPGPSRRPARGRRPPRISLEDG